MTDDLHLHNQLQLFLENFFTTTLLAFVTYLCLIIHYMMQPLNMIHQLFNYSLYQIRVIGSFVIGDILKICNFIWLNFELLYNMVETQRSNLFKYTCGKTYRRKNLTIYRRMKVILNDFHVLPLSPRDALTTFFILKRIPVFVWKNIIPFPRFFFEDTISNAVVDDGKIFVTLPPTIPVPAIVMKESINEDEQKPVTKKISGKRKKISFKLPVSSDSKFNTIPEMPASAASKD